MAIPLKVRKAVLARDGNACYHCGDTGDTIVLNHRINRGMGGSKLLDGPENLITVCSAYNSALESSGPTAVAGRGWAHKLSTWEKPLERPVFECHTFTWWVLNEDGTRTVFDVIDPGTHSTF